MTANRALRWAARQAAAVLATWADRADPPPEETPAAVAPTPSQVERDTASRRLAVALITSLTVGGPAELAPNLYAEALLDPNAVRWLAMLGAAVASPFDAGDGLGPFSVLPAIALDGELKA